MKFEDESTAYELISETVVKAGISLVNAIKYICAVSEKDLYSISIRDILKNSLKDITNTKSLFDEGETEIKAPKDAGFERVLPLVVYSFAVRLPELKYIKTSGGSLTDKQIKDIFDIISAKGAANYGGVIEEDIGYINKLVKKKKPVPVYDADWFKSYIMNFLPSLREFTNANMFLLGSCDILFTLFYESLMDRLGILVCSLADY